MWYLRFLFTLMPIDSNFVACQTKTAGSEGLITLYPYSPFSPPPNLHQIWFPVASGSTLIVNKLPQSHLSDLIIPYASCQHLQSERWAGRQITDDWEEIYRPCTVSIRGRSICDIFRSDLRLFTNPFYLHKLLYIVTKTNFSELKNCLCCLNVLLLSM